jgi:hypothetical protein
MILPACGDVLVSRRSASQDYEISVIPEEAQLVGEGYEAAIAHALNLAARLSVDAWYTEDLIHFVRIETCASLAGNLQREALE